MTSIRTGRHCVFELHVHLVFVAKYRKKIFTQEHIDALRVIAAKVCEDFGAEITVHPAKNIVLKGSGAAADPYSAFDNANEHIATRLRRHKTKLSGHKSKIGLAELAYSAVLPLVEQDEEVDVNENAPLTIAETDANIPVCTVSEAVMLMDLSNECAQMFRNSANNHISMVYRRKDGNIGWVEPKADN